LNSQGVETSTFGSLLNPIVLNLLPKDIVFPWYRDQTADDCHNFTSLLDYIQKELDGRERTAETSFIQFAPNPRYEKKFTPNRVNNRNMSTTSIFNASSDYKICDLCNGSHYSSQCDKDDDIEAR